MTLLPINGRDWNEWVSAKFSPSYALANILFFDSIPLILADTNSNPKGTYKYINNSFFPLDGKGFKNEGLNHNFSFTMELHNEFTYMGNEFLDFTGDDDVWVFINGKLALDLGGIHEPRSGSFRTRDIEKSHNLELGKTYRFDLFFAERHVVQSNIMLTTNIVKPVDFKAAEYYETDTRPDGLIDLIKVRVDKGVVVTADMLDKLYESVVLPDHRKFSYDKSSFRLIADGFEIAVKQPKDMTPVTSVDNKDVLELTKNIEINGQVVLTKQKISISDKLGAVINKAVFSFGTYPGDPAQGKDTLQITYSEKVLIPKSVEPFQFCYKGDNQRLYIMTLDLAVLSGGDNSDVTSFRVVTRGKDIPEDGDSIWIREGGKIVDAATIPQALATISRPLIVRNKIKLISHVIGPVEIGTPIDPAVIQQFNLNQTEGTIILVELHGLLSTLDAWTGKCSVFDPVGNTLAKDISALFREIITSDGTSKKFLVFVWNCRNRNDRYVGPGSYLGLLSVYRDGKFFKSEKVYIGLKETK